MSDDIRTQVRIDTSSDPSGLDAVIRKLLQTEKLIDKINKAGFGSISKKVAESVSGGDGAAAFARKQKDEMAALRARFSFESRMRRQREAEEKAAADASQTFHADDIRRVRERMNSTGALARQRVAAARETERAETQAFRSSLKAVHETMSVTGAMDRQRRREEAAAVAAADKVANARTKAARDAAMAEEAAAKQSADAWAKARNQITSGVGKVRAGTTRAVVAGAVTSGIVGAGARRGIDTLTKSGVSIDDALTQASIHIFGQMSPEAARVAALDLRKRLMPVATKLGTSTADLIAATVEASQAGVSGDILAITTETGAKFAKMNKLSLPSVLEESGYAIQGLKTFGKVTDETVGKFFNHSAYLIATTAANRTQMNSFAKRGLAAGASVGMSLDDTLAFGAAATAAGAQGSQASRMLSSQGGRIAGWEMKGRDIQRKRQRTEEDRLFLSIPSTLGFGSFSGLAKSFKTDFLGTFATVQERLKTIADPLKRRSMEKQLFGQEFGALTDSMVMGSNLKEYRNKLNSKEADTFLDKNWEKQTGSFGFIIDQIKSVVGNLKDSLGLALKPLYEDIKNYVTALPSSFDNFEEAFRSGLSGFMRGIGSPDGTMAGALRSMFGEPGAFKVNVQAVSDFAKGFGQGLRSVYDTVRGFISMFAGSDQSAEAIGRITAKFLGFTSVLMVAAPVVTVLGAIGGAIAGLVTIATGAATALRAAGLIGGGAGVAAAGSAAGGAAGAAGAAAGLAKKGSILGKLGGAFGLYGLAEAAQSYGIFKQDGSGGIGRSILNFLDPGVASRVYGDAAPAPADTASTSETPRPWVDPPTREKPGQGHKAASIAAEAKAALVTSLDALRVSVDALRETIGKRGVGGFGDDTSRAIRDLATIQRASLTKADLARAGAAGTVSAAMSRAGIGSTGSGIPYTPGAGGSALYGNTPGQSFSTPGVGARHGLGGSPVTAGPPVPMTGSGATVAKGSLSSNQQEAYRSARAEGLSDKAARALVANMSGESLRNPRDHHWDVRHMSQGIVQWDPQRAGAIQSKFGKLPKDMTVAEQTRAAIWEIRSQKRFARTKAALEGDHEGTMLDALVRNYEAPAEPGKAIAERSRYYRGFTPNASTAPLPDGKALAEAAGTALGKGIVKPSKDVGDGMKSTGFHRASASDLAKEAPHERLAREAPGRSGSGVGHGGGVTHAPITIHTQGQDPQTTAAAVQRHLQDSQNYAPNDASFESI